ncbi:MAG: DUF1553 domain-containing protein, partial [Mariniblastus sp.]
MRTSLVLSIIVLVALLQPSQTVSALPVTCLQELHAPVAIWDFQDSLSSDSSGGMKGEVKGSATSATGPAAPVYPSFSHSNRALSLRAPSWIKLTDDFEDDRFDFTNGDAITLEAWVKPTGGGENMYVIGKGRTAVDGAKSKNQNWALRLRKINGQPCLNFLFHSQGDGDTPGDWHRWTSTTGFSFGPRWHHVAVVYKFGDPKSIVGYIDGKVVKGRWDMGGETTSPPVTDDDDVWIGSAMNGNPGNSLEGLIDEIAVHRRIVSSKEIESRFQWDPPKVKPPTIPPGKVAVQLFGPISGHKVLPKEVEPALLEWEQDQFGFVRIPQKYDSWGVRNDWGQTLLIRAWANIELPAGEYNLLARSRGLARLKIDGKEILKTRVQANRNGAHHVVEPLPKLLVEGMRPHWMNDNEQTGRFESAGGRHTVLFEMIVGAGNCRVEMGEPCVAISQGNSMFHLLSPSTLTPPTPLTDEGWLAFAESQSQSLDQFDRVRRQTANSMKSDYWAKRHQHARSRLISKATHFSIDELIFARINQTNKLNHLENTDGSLRTEYFDQQVRPILQKHCYRCHGEKRKGELSLLSRENLLRGGESGEPGIVPGKPDESRLMEMITAVHDGDRMPPTGEGVGEDETNTIRRWIIEGAVMSAQKRPKIELTQIVDDYTFLRRVFVDTVGVPPTLAETKSFLSDTSSNRREKLIDQLLRDPRWADNWVGYWQDVLAENPNLLKPTLNNTGPFRWWIHEALVDNKPVDRFATELILMLGSKWGGGSAGFAVASQNDVPMAAKAHVIGSAFLGVNMKCARCHDAPYHQWKQSDLFELAAMLDRKTLKLPRSSTVPAAFFEKQQRQPLINATLKPGSELQPSWPLHKIAPEKNVGLMFDTGDTRERLSVRVTGSRRFAEVIANRIWKRLMGSGLVEPVDDWEGNSPSDPVLLATLADHLIRLDYDSKKLMKLILISETYQRTAIDGRTDKERHFGGPHRRRMTAEQIVDSALHVVGQDMVTEPLTMDIEGALAADKFLNFGRPNRSWELTTLANERDRPSLALPRAQAVADVLKAFGWRNSRPEPETTREVTPNLIQPGVLANGTFGNWLTRLSDESDLTVMALQTQTIEQLVDDLFLRLLTRLPTATERALYVKMLTPGFRQRVVPPAEVAPAPLVKRFRYVSWSNH